MENTETNYTTNKTLMDYIDANIDVHIDYLLFANSFKCISSKALMTVAPTLESIRSELHQAFAYDNILDNTMHVNKLIEKKLIELLNEHDISDICEHIGESLTKEDIVNLSTAVFLRRSVNYIPDIDHQPISTDEYTVQTILKRLKQEIPSSNLKINGYSQNITRYFLESLRIKDSKNETLEAYIYEFIHRIKIISEVIKNNEYENEFRFIIEELINSKCVMSNYSLCNMIDELIIDINSLNKKDQKKLTLE